VISPRYPELTLTENKRTIDRYMAGFRAVDHAVVLSCLTDDVEWEIPGMFHARGKAAFDQEIENEAFVGHPDIVVARMIEEDDVVVAEGSVRTQKRDGGELRLRFCDVFDMEGARIKRLTSYLTDFK
jgi:ketosteroid isomerase-like protein